MVVSVREKMVMVQGMQEKCEGKEMRSWVVTAGRGLSWLVWGENVVLGLAGLGLLSLGEAGEGGLVLPARRGARSSGKCPGTDDLGRITTGLEKSSPGKL